MDAADIAAEREVIHRAESLARAGVASAHGPSRATCAHCGRAIPKARQQAVPGVSLCVRCQEEHDR